MNRDDVLATIEDILEVPRGSVQLDAALDELDWDSLASISFIAALDQNFGLRVDPQSLSSATTVEQLLGLVPTAP